MHNLRLFIILIAIFSATITLSATPPSPKPNPLHVSNITVATIPIREEPQEGLAPEATDNLQKKFTLEGFFAGKTVAKGTIFSKTVGVARSFNATTLGKWDGKVLTLIETYTYAAGNDEQRVWRFKKKSDGVYVGTSDEILKKTVVTIKGRVATYKYKKKIPRGKGKKPVTVTFHEELAFRKNGLLLSETKLKKFVNVGQEKINYVRVGNEETLVAPKF